MPEIKPVSFGPATPEEIALDAEAQQLLDASLKRIRASAADWAKTIASLTGILGVVGLIKGREDVTELVIQAQVLIGLFLAAGLIMAAYSILLAALAAEGSPTTWWVVGQKLKDHSRDERELAARQLLRSRTQAVGAAICLVIAVGIAWYSPEEEPAPKPAKVVVTFSDRGPLCGELAGTAQGLAVASGSGQVTIGGGNVKTLNVVSSCPESPQR